MKRLALLAALGPVVGCGTKPEPNGPAMPPIPIAANAAPACRALGELVNAARACTDIATPLRNELAELARTTEPALCASLFANIQLRLRDRCGIAALVAPVVPVDAAVADGPRDEPIGGGIDAAPGSRDVAAEAGVPFDRAAVGSLPHPFGALEILKANITRDEILAALPAARRKSENRIEVPLGVEHIVAMVDIDRADRLDVVRIPVTPAQVAILEKAWGPQPWFDRVHRWRADLEKPDELVVGPYIPLAEQLTLVPTIGTSVADLRAKFGKRYSDEDHAITFFASEICMYFTGVEVEIAHDRVTSVDVTPCFMDDTARHAVLATLERVWGRAVAVRVDDEAVLQIGGHITITREEQGYRARIK